MPEELITIVLTRDEVAELVRASLDARVRGDDRSRPAAAKLLAAANASRARLMEEERL